VSLGFAGEVVHFYARYRRGYPAATIEAVVAAFGVTGSSPASAPAPPWRPMGGPASAQRRRPHPAGISAEKRLTNPPSEGWAGFGVAAGVSFRPGLWQPQAVTGDLGVVGVGYEGLGLAAFVEGISLTGIVTLVDVRLTPLSRKPGFSKRALAGALAEAGVTYRHLPALGNPRENRPGFSGTPTQLDSARAEFGRRLDSGEGEAALGVILRWAQDGPVAMLCFEADERRCHRYVVLDRLRRRLALAIAG
jgi:hypothetical protein